MRSGGDLPSMSSVLNLPHTETETDDGSHYQLQGTWTVSTGKHYNYLVLKDSLESSAEISNLYFNVEDVMQSAGCDNLNLNNINERLHINLLHLISEFPSSEIVSELFRDFLNNLQPLASVQVSERLVKTSRLLESKVPKIQLKLENYQYEEDGKENVIIDGTSQREESLTCDEERFVEACKSLKQKTTTSDHYSVKQTDSGSEAVCLYCYKTFSSSSSDAQQNRTESIAQVVDHILVIHFNTFAYKCDLCETTFNEKSSFEAHLNEPHEPVGGEKLFQCSSCPQRFASKIELTNHSKSEHSTKRPADLKCEQCDKVFSSKKTKYSHLRTVHGTSSRETKKDKAASACMCPVCGEKKKSEHNLSQHIKKFHENAYPEPIVCGLCTEIKQLRNRKYHTPYSYELHMKQIHSGGSEGKQVCEFCCKEFIGSIGKVKFALKEHIQAVHMGIRKACDECGKTFISNIVLNKHKKHVHRKEGSYPCKGCGRVFRYSQQAIDHEYKDRGLTPYECKQCPFKTADNWALAKHKKFCPATVAIVENNIVPGLNLTL